MLPVLTKIKRTLASNIKCKEACSLELGYLNRSQKKNNTTVFLDSDNIRFTLIKNFDLR